MPEVKIPIEVSARHIHLSRRLVNILFGKNYELTPEKELSQLGMFLCKERLRIVGPRDIIHNVAVLGPVREHTQVEISMTDARNIGISPNIRESGHHDDTAACRLVGPAGEYELNNGVIVARRHLHCDPSSADKLGVHNRDIVSIEIKDSLRPVIFKDVVVRVKESFALSLHLDTDEGNAAGLIADSYGVIFEQNNPH